MAAPSPAVVTVTDAYLPLRELARYAGVSVRTLRACLTDPTHPLPHYRYGGKVLVRRSDFDAWAIQFRVTETSGFDALVADVLKGL